MMQYLVSGKMLAGTTICHDIPKKYQHLQFPFATHFEFTSGPFGAMLNQAVANDDWVIQLMHFFISKPVRMCPFSPRPLGALHCMLAGHLPCTLKGFGDVVLHEKELHFSYVPAGARNLALFSKGYYESFQIGFSPGYLARFAQNGSPLKDVCYKLENSLPESGYAGSCPLSLQAMEQIEKIRDCPLKDARRHLFYQARINDLMLLYISALEDSHHPKETINRYEEKMRQLSVYITDNLEKPLMIARLADQLGLHLHVAQKEFKKVYHQTIKSFIQEQRMKRAILLLTEGKMPVIEVAYTVGYSDGAYFSNVFKKLFGITPTAYQKMKKAITDKDLL
jgi:AraC-like DNA-binding protein